MTISVNYVGDQSHFLNTGGNARGYWANQLNPIYLAALGGVTDSTGTKPILIAAATSANVAKAQTAMAGINIPAFYQNAANANPNSSTLTIAQGLVAFPQYSRRDRPLGRELRQPHLPLLPGHAAAAHGPRPLLQHQLHLLQEHRRRRHLPQRLRHPRRGHLRRRSELASGSDRRSWTTVSVPQDLHAFGVYQLPFGKGHIGSDSMLVRTLAGGWTLSGIYTYGSGTPVAVISGVCSANQLPAAGPVHARPQSRATNARINGSYGTGPNGTNACNLGLGPGCTAIQYIDSRPVQEPTNVSTVPADRST